MSDMAPIYDLVLGQNGLPGWKLDLDILAPGGLLGIGKSPFHGRRRRKADEGCNEDDNNAYYTTILDDVRAKADIGAPVS